MTFTRPTTIAERQLQAIAVAYAAAGVQMPNRTTETLAAIQQEPGVEQVAAELAREAHTAKSAKTFLDKALERIARAQAADALRAAVAGVSTQINREQMPSVLSRAVTDLEPAFDALVATLSTAGADLDPSGPMLIENAIRDDTTRQHKQAQAALDLLGVLASIHISRPVRDVPRDLAAVLPVVSLPQCEREAIIPTHHTPSPVMNASALTGTYVVRQLARDLEKDIDGALVGIACGRYEGVTLALADRAELKLRIWFAQKAFQRRPATPEEQRAKQSAVVA